MKILASLSDKYAVFSVSHHDFRKAPDGTMADGGAPGCQNYAGYTRSSGKMGYIDLPNVTFADLYNDYAFYNTSSGILRKYGVHLIEEVRVWPDNNSFAWKKENAIWKTHGKDGKGKGHYIRLLDAENSHLNAILDTVAHLTDNTREIIESILKDRGADYVSTLQKNLAELEKIPDAPLIKGTGPVSLEKAKKQVKELQKGGAQGYIGRTKK